MSSPTRSEQSPGAPSVDQGEDTSLAGAPASEPVESQEPRKQKERAKLRELLARLDPGGPFWVRSLPLTVLCLIAVAVVLHYGRWIFFPVGLAIFLQLLLTPVVSALTLGGRIPRTLAAGFVLLVLGGGIGFGIYRLAGPAAEWARELPSVVEDLAYRFRDVKRQVDEIAKAAESVGSAMDSEAHRTDVVQMKDPSFTAQLFSGAATTLAGAVVCLALLFFFLSSDDGTLRKIVRVLPDLAQKKIAVVSMREIESSISTYLLSITLINVVLGCLVGAWVGLLGLPNPALWGVMAGLLNFVPYIGSVAGVLVVAIVSVGQADSVPAGLLAPAGYACLTMLEGMLVTPAILGRSLILSPVALLVWLSLWAWIWGVPGAILAVPMLVAIKILCDRVPPLQIVGEFLGR